MSHYAVIKPKQDHVIKSNTRQVSLKVTSNAEVVSKEIEQPRATFTYSDYDQGHRDMPKSTLISNSNDEMSHIIFPSNRRIRGFKVQCVNGKIVNKQLNKIPVNQQISNKHKQIPEFKLQAEAHNSLQPIIKQRQSDEFMFSLQPQPIQKQTIPLEMPPSTIPISQNNAITFQQQKQKTIIESIVSREQIIERGGFIQIEKEDQQCIMKKERQQIVSKQIKHYQIEENYVNSHQNAQNVKSPLKEKHRHPIFTNQNAEFFQESAVQGNSVHPHPQNMKAEYKYTPIHDIQSPKHHFYVNQPSYNGIQSKYEDKSFYLNNQNQL